MFSKRTNWNLAQNSLAGAIERAASTQAGVLDLTASNPTTVGITYPTAQILEALSREQSMYYEPAAKGLTVAREAIACYYGEHGVLISPNDVVVTVSTSEAYSYCFRLLCDPGDEVLVPAPSYPLFDFLADILDVKLVPYELVYDHGWQIEIESLRKGIGPRTKAVMVVHPNNPTGHYTKQWELDCLNALCAHHNLAIISDEVFFDYNIAKTSAKSFAANRGALTFTLSGLSKISGLPQMKAAWIVTSGPDLLAREADARLEVIADTYLSPNAPIQNALPTMLEARQSIQSQLNHRVKNNLAELDRQLARQQTCRRLVVEGGWYAILRVPVTQTDEELCIALINSERVLAHPGHFYNFAQDGFLIVSLITEERTFHTGIERLLAFVNRV